MGREKKDSDLKGTWITIELSSEINGLITTAKEDSRRSKRAEAELRLADHLKRFSHISAEGIVTERNLSMETSV